MHLFDKLSLTCPRLWSIKDICIGLYVLKRLLKQNRSTEGCSKLKRSVDMTCSGKNGLNIRTNISPKWDRTRCPGGVSVLCWLAAPVALFYGNLQNLGNKVKIGNKVKFGKKVANCCNIWLIEGVIVYGHVPECHVTFGRGRLHNVWWDPHIDHKTSWMTISNVPWHIPVRGAEMKVAPPLE